MNIMELSPNPRKVQKSNIVQFRTREPKPIISSSIRSQEVVGEKTKTKWFAKYKRENLTFAEALVRGTLVVVIPVLSAIDWNYGTHAMFYIAPIICYSEVTVFTMTCPIKSLFSNYRSPSDDE